MRIALDEEIGGEWIGDFQSDARRAVKKFRFRRVRFWIRAKQSSRPGSFLLGSYAREAGSRKGVEENRALQPMALLLQNSGVEIEISPEGFELLFRPRADGVVLGFFRHSTEAAQVGETSGNWLHFRPSRSRPLDFGRRPPHCLKKSATPLARH